MEDLEWIKLKQEVDARGFALRVKDQTIKELVGYLEKFLANEFEIRDQELAEQLINKVKKGKV